MEEKTNLMPIYVDNLSHEITKEDAEEVFREYAIIKPVHLASDRETFRFRGFAFEEMSSDAEEAKAIETWNGATWMDQELKVNQAKEGLFNRSNCRDNRF